MSRFKKRKHKKEKEEDLISKKTRYIKQSQKRQTYGPLKDVNTLTIKTLKSLDPSTNYLLIVDEKGKTKKLKLQKFLFGKDTFKSKDKMVEDVEKSSDTEEEPLSFSQKMRK